MHRAEVIFVRNFYKNVRHRSQFLQISKHLPHLLKHFHRCESTKLLSSDRIKLKCDINQFYRWKVNQTQVKLLQHDLTIIARTIWQFGTSRRLQNGRILLLNMQYYFSFLISIGSIISANITTKHQLVRVVWASSSTS